ncbi:hypothetical protein W97_08425 [Coniosporium apollinis CBS 100218]|uniref:CCR4-NOT transcription complex subunit 4 n=1 Tax=Coniosporium apollinis (strain CBS 100218) TaxID=1168221 RepID=R7Z4Z9_CONA1|nr:uncharacterized protein W97_08425 [Coniosporium apollinis CBS 100218]EON69265.1 hypothetical protein W97_08425 [Coniosporium apollinis CBS 100218]
MSRSQLDQFIEDDGEETCPLCVEDMDPQDRKFRPCPCGYQICQFCYNNIKNNVNGLCPACRRPYDEKNIDYTPPSAEELANHKANLQAQARKKAAARQKEAQKREADNLSRKHLAGLRVVQKNLVYVTGLSPTTREDRLLETLRGPQYFGQYGKIVKIVVSNAKHTSMSQPAVGVYVTFENKEDAAKCIAAVDGSQNGERILRAQYGTTKYCSAYLRNEICNNRNCMFLHEPGEENESFTRQDMSSISAISSQQPAQVHTSSSRPLQPQAPPPQQAPHPIAAASQPMDKQDSKDGSGSPTDSQGDGSALPSSASWGKQVQDRQTSRAASGATSGTTASPQTTAAVPAPQPAESSKSRSEAAPKVTEKDKEAKAETPKSSTPQSQLTDTLPEPPAATQKLSRPRKPRLPYLDDALKILSTADFTPYFSAANLDPEDLEIVTNFPSLIDPNGGAKLRARKNREAERLRQAAEARDAQQAALTVETEEATEGAGGSLQLGGEPEERQDVGFSQSLQHAIQPPSQQLPNSTNLGLGQNLSLADNLGNFDLYRGFTPQQQQQQLLLQQLQSASPQKTNLLNAFQGTQSQQAQHGSSHNQQGGSAPGHARHTSRFTFANDTASASAQVKPVVNAKLMNQQSSMMPQNNNHFNPLSQPQQLGNQFFSSAVQGPPPGLKTTGTPPVSGGGMFGQGHGFATGSLVYGANAASRNANEEMMQDLLRGRAGNARVGNAQEVGKRESMFPSFLNHHPMTSASGTAPGLPSFPYGPSPGAYQDSGSQKPKKKGKKHRHANTSSSGGGGIVDVADPSILQARLHQGGVLAGQGLYGGQGQGGFSSVYGGGGFNNRW